MPAPESFKFDLEQENCDCHILPCSINYEGAVDLSKFPIETSPRLFTRLRGRPLHGKAVDLSVHGFRGVSIDPVATEEQDSEQELEDISEDTESHSSRPNPCKYTFKTITVWEHGKEPAEDDAWGGRLEDLLRMAGTMEKLQTL